MKTAFILSLWLAFCSITCSNTSAMNKTLQHIRLLASEEHIDKATVETLLEVRLAEDKKASEAQGMSIFRMGADNILSAYSTVELRLFNGGSNFFLLVCPVEPLPLALEELKQGYTYKGFTTGDPLRKELPGYHFEKNGRAIIFYCDDKLKNIEQVSVAGKTT